MFALYLLSPGSNFEPKLDMQNEFQGKVIVDIQMSNTEFVLSLYGKCPKISNTFLFLFSNKMLVVRAGVHKMLVRIANREDPDLTASSEAV